MSGEQFTGIPVLSCLPGSPAERAGVRRGDRLLVVNGVRMGTVDDYLTARAIDRRGLTMTLQRGNEIHEVALAFDFDERMPLPPSGSA